MPNAIQYRQAAIRLRRLGCQFDQQAVMLADWPIDAAGRGPAFDLVSERLSAIALRLGFAADRLTAAGDECERRATLCDEYARRVLAWSLLPAATRLLTPFPIAPYRWVAA